MRSRERIHADVLVCDERISLLQRQLAKAKAERQALMIELGPHVFPWKRGDVIAKTNGLGKTEKLVVLGYVVDRWSTNVKLDVTKVTKAGNPSKAAYSPLFEMDIRRWEATGETLDIPEDWSR
jgi:hypothetical protein